MSRKWIFGSIFYLVGIPALLMVSFGTAIAVGDKIAREPLSEIHAKIASGMNRDAVTEVIRKNLKSSI